MCPFTGSAHRTHTNPTIPFKSLPIPFNLALMHRDRADFDELVAQSRKQVEKGENVFRPMCVALPLASKLILCFE